MTSVKTPQVLWAQRSSATTKEKNFIYLTVDLPGIIHSTLKYTVTDTTISLKVSAKEGDEQCEYALELDFYAEVYPEAFKKCITLQSVTIVIFKKDITPQYWPQLSKIALPYVKTGFSRWTWQEGNESDGVDEDCSTDIMNFVDMDSPSAGPKSGGLLKSLNQATAPPSTKTPATPQVLWAQHSSLTERMKNIICLSVHAPDIAESTLKCIVTETSISFCAYAREGYEKREYAFNLDFYADVIPEALEKHLTEQYFTIILPKKQMDAQYWPRLQKMKAALPYVGSDFKWQWGWEGDESDGIISGRTDIDSWGMDSGKHSMQAEELSNHGIFFLTRFEDLGQIGDIEKSIQCFQEVLKLRPASHPNWSSSLDNLANALFTRFEQMGEFEDLEKSIQCHQEALELFPSSHPNRSNSLNNLANALSRRFEQKGDFEDLEESIQCHREALDLRPAPHPKQSSSLTNLANALSTRFGNKGDIKDLEESIQCHREALVLSPPPHSNQSSSLNNLANALSTRFEQRGNLQDLEESIQCYREALELFPPPHPNRSSSLNNLAYALSTRFEQKGDFEDLEESIQCHQKAIELFPASHPNRFLSLNNLGNAFSTRFGNKGDIEDLEKSIQFYQKALELSPLFHPNRSNSLSDLANALSTRFEKKGNFKDLEDSIQYHREALELRPAPHPNRSSSLNNLANALSSQFEKKGDFENLEESIQCYQEALVLRPAPHPNRSSSLNDLANALSTRFGEKGDVKDLEACIQCYREAFKSELRPSPHPNQSGSLNNLLNGLSTQFKQKRDFKDLEESIQEMQLEMQPSQSATHDQSLYQNPTAAQPQMQFGLSNEQDQFLGITTIPIQQQQFLQQQQQLSQDIFNQGQPQMYVTCWIAAEHALQHIERYHPQIETIFKCYNIRRSQYAVYAGFDESCIQRGSGYLEQIHIFTLSTILANSPLLTELGKILSPFSSILFTESSRFSLPVYKDDGTIWEFDELVFKMASKYLDHGSTAAMCPTVISLSQSINNKADESQQDSGGGNGENVEKKDSKGSEEKGDGQNRDNGNGGKNPGDPSRDSNHSSGHPGNSGNRGIDGDPDDPEPEGETKETTNSPNIAFEVVSSIYTNGNLSQIFQQINTAGELTIQMDNNSKNPTCQVQFTKLEFGNETPTPDVAYHQFHCRVIIDSRLNSRITGAKPERTRASEKETTVTVSGKTTETKTGSGTIGASTSGLNIGTTGTYAKAAEEGTSSATKQFNSQITKQAKLGVVWWGFDVHDASLQQGGRVFEEPELPTATFHFRPEAKKCTPVPDHIDIEVASYWSIIPSPTVTSNIGWLSKILPLTSNGSPTVQYSHLCQMTALKIPSDLKEHSDYCAVLSVDTTGAGLHFKSDISHPGSESVEIDSQVIRRMDSTPFKYEDVRKSSLELPSFRHYLVSSDNMWSGPLPRKRSNAEPAGTASMATATNEQ